MKYYPVFLNLEQRNCLVVGAGQVGKRKILTLANYSPQKLTIIDIAPADKEISILLAKNPNWQFIKRPFQKEDLQNIFLVLACTEDAKLNEQIARLCREKNILCNSANKLQKNDPTTQADIILPAICSQNDFTLAISSGGKSPALAKHLRQRLEKMISEEYAPTAILLGKIRQDVLALKLAQGHNAQIFSALVGDELLTCIKLQDKNKLEQFLQVTLPQQLHPKIRTDYVNLF